MANRNPLPIKYGRQVAAYSKMISLNPRFVLQNKTRQKISGTTIVQKPELYPPTEIQKEGLTGFVGAVTDGLYGAVVFDFKSPHDFVEARKSWFFFDDEYVCLGTGIKSNRDLPVVTTINQVLMRTDVTVKKAGKIDFRVEKSGIVHVPMGKVSFGPQKIVENITAFLETILKLKPSSSKGTYLKGIAVSTTMGPGIKIDTALVKELMK